MKYHAISPPPKLMVRRVSAVAMIEDGVLFERFLRHGWLRPAKRATKKTDFDLYAVKDIETAVERLKREDLPD